MDAVMLLLHWPSIAKDDMFGSLLTLICCRNALCVLDWRSQNGLHLLSFRNMILIMLLPVRNCHSAVHIAQTTHNSFGTILSGREAWSLIRNYWLFPPKENHHICRWRNILLVEQPLVCHYHYTTGVLGDLTFIFSTVCGWLQREWLIFQVQSTILVCAISRGTKGL